MVKGKNNNKKDVYPKSKIIKTIIFYVLITLILSQILTALTGFTIVDPILDKFGHKKIKIEPINYPLVREDKHFIRINILNEGLGKIKDLNADYKLHCDSDDFKKAELHKRTLSKGQEDFFEFKAELDTNCSLGTDPTNIDFYADKDGQCYIKIEKKTSNICSYCILDVNVYDGYDKIENLTYWYPFNEGNLTIDGTVPIENSCLSYEKAKNISSLKLLPEYNIKITMFDFSIGCIRGDIEKEWCKEYYPELY